MAFEPGRSRPRSWGPTAVSSCPWSLRPAGRRAEPTENRRCRCAPRAGRSRRSHVSVANSPLSSPTSPICLSSPEPLSYSDSGHSRKAGKSGHLGRLDATVRLARADTSGVQGFFEVSDLSSVRATQTISPCLKKLRLMPDGPIKRLKQQSRRRWLDDNSRFRRFAQIEWERARRTLRGRA